MTTKIKFVADDGSEFDSEELAQKRDSLFHRVRTVMAALGEIHPDVKAGNGWFQHDLETVLLAKDGILELCRQEGFADSWPVFNNKGRDCHAGSIIGRILSDNGGPLWSAWSRFGSIDAKGREHQQPYFANNGPESKHLQVNP